MKSIIYYYNWLKYYYIQRMGYRKFCIILLKTKTVYISYVIHAK